MVFGLFSVCKWHLTTRYCYNRVTVSVQRFNNVRCSVNVCKLEWWSWGGMAQWVERLTPICQWRVQTPSKVPVVSQSQKNYPHCCFLVKLSKKLYPHCLVLVGTRIRGMDSSMICKVACFTLKLKTNYYYKLTHAC